MCKQEDISMGEKTVDMTKGSILPKMIRFALPVLLGMLFQRIYNFVDGDRTAAIPV